MKKKTLCLFGFIMSLVLLASACSSKKDAATASYDSSYTMKSMGDANTYDVVEEAPAAAANGSNQDQMTITSGTSLSNSSALETGTDAMQPQDKIIRTFNLEVETQEFDNFITTINSEIQSLGGYVESSDIAGKPYNYGSDTRYGNIIARIPSDKVDGFVNTVGDNANIIKRNESTENVSLQYIDAESRVETLKIEQERLFAILEKEINLDNIITLESRLSDIRYELQNYESQLRFYDNQVAYSTVTMNITEVDKLTPVTEKKPSMGTRIQNGFKKNMNNIGEGLQDFCVWFIANLPYLLIWAVIIAIIAFVIRRLLKKSNNKRAVSAPMSGGQQYFVPDLNKINQNPFNQNQINQNPVNQNSANQNQENQNPENRN